MGITGMTAFNNAFRTQGTPVLCGIIDNPFETITNLVQALNKAPDKVALPSMPVKITNNVSTAQSTNVLADMNIGGLSITGLATTSAETSAFMLAGQTDIQDIDGGVGYPQTGMMCQIGLLGSGIKTFLPADTSLANVPLNSPVYWDTTNAQLKLSADTTANPPLPIKLLSARVAARKLVKNTTTGLVEWVDSFAVKVQL